MNLLSNVKENERLLSKGYETMISVSQSIQLFSDQELQYIPFDFADEFKKRKNNLSEFIMKELNKTLNEVGMFVAKFDTKKEIEVFQKQNGILRTNCFDCLDRTNVTQTAIALFVFEQMLSGGVMMADIEKSVCHLWACAGDCISKIYAGTRSVMTNITIKGKENTFDKIIHKYKSLERLVIQNFSDEDKQECVNMLTGLHPLC